MGLVSKQEKFDHLFSLFCELDDWARKHDVKLFLDWGTMLGAVRHRGFIPWDFDLDVGVKWGDYQKLLAAWEADPLPNRDIVNIDRYEDYPALFSRFIDCETTEIRVHSAWDMGPCGMSIDIFPLIPLPADERKSQAIQDAMLVYYELKNPFMLNKRTREASMKRLLVKMRIREKIFGRKSTLKKLESILFSVPEEECVAYVELTAGSRKACTVSKAVLGEYTELPFEGRMCYVPEHYIEYLQDGYGVDWRNYPANRSGGYHYVENLHVPYDVYVEDYMQLLNRDEILATMRRAKKLDLTDVVLRPIATGDCYRVAADAILAKIEAFGSPSDFLEEVPEDLEKQLMKYMDKQLSARFNYWGIWGGINDDWLAVLLGLLYRKQMYRQVMKLTSMRSDLCKTPIPDSVAVFKDRIEYLYAIYNAMDYQDDQKVVELMAGADERGVGEYMHILSGLYLMRSRGGEAGRLLAAATAAAGEYPDDDYVEWYRAYALAKTGRLAEAEKIWECLEENSINGMILLAIQDDREECKHGSI